MGETMFTLAALAVFAAYLLPLIIALARKVRLAAWRR
jgi:hypothetical protein